MFGDAAVCSILTSRSSTLGWHSTDVGAVGVWQGIGRSKSRGLDSCGIPPLRTERARMGPPASPSFGKLGDVLLSLGFLMTLDSKPSQEKETRARLPGLHGGMPCGVHIAGMLGDRE